MPIIAIAMTIEKVSFPLPKKKKKKKQNWGGKTCCLGRCWIRSFKLDGCLVVKMLFVPNFHSHC